MSIQASRINGLPYGIIASYLGFLRLKFVFPIQGHDTTEIPLVVIESVDQ
jgi:hypothetical protein